MRRLSAGGWRTTLPPSCPAPLVSWLRERGSLTRRCEQRSEHFAVRLLRQTFSRALADDHGQRCLVREVLLLCDQQAVIFAHTTLAPRPRGRLTLWLTRLGNRSLGSLLFHCKSFSRGPIEFRRLKPGDPLFAHAIAASGITAKELWARRSAHRLGCQQVLVTEVFLPRIIELRGT